jgi:hypothetical protein
MTRRWLIIVAFAVTGLGGFAAGNGWKDWRLERCREQRQGFAELAELRAQEVEHWRTVVEKGSP